MSLVFEPESAHEKADQEHGYFLLHWFLLVHCRWFRFECLLLAVFSVSVCFIFEPCAVSVIMQYQCSITLAHWTNDAVRIWTM